MQYLANGTVVFNTMGELYYDLFMELGLGIGRDQYLYDQETHMPLKFKDKFIKADVNDMPIYPGKNDIIFEPATNYALTEKIFGYYLDKCQHDEDGDILQGYVAHYIEDNETKDKQRVVVKTIGKGEIASNYYFCIYLAYLDCIFKIAGYNPDLSNFDVIPEKK